MAIVVNIDIMLARRKMTSGELAEKVGISATNLSILKTGNALDCQPGDILSYEPDSQ